jgi:formylglycine-generating enzyme required for sulfatase activity
MHGNVCEWCNDFYAEYDRVTEDPKGPSRGMQRVLRGGSWQDPAADCRSAFRLPLEPTKRLPANGFRVVCEIAK